MATRLKLLLDPDEYEGLVRLATADLRLPNDQLRHLLRLELARRDLLPKAEPCPSAQPAQAQPAEARP